MDVNFNKLIEDYKNVIASWRKRGDVQSGKDLAYRVDRTKPALIENIPLGFGTGTGTTGWCVSASQSLIDDVYFQELLKIRNAKAKLVSIDIKEQHYGYCFNGSQNKWHTAILVYDSNVYFIIDVTCRQFGNKFVNKDIWTFDTWQNTFRSSRCKHKLTDFSENEFDYIPKLNSGTKFNSDYFYAEVVNNLHNHINLDANDRIFIADFMVNQLKTLNNKLLTRSINVQDYNYINELNKKLAELPTNCLNKTYGILEFETKNSAKNWLKHFLKNECKLDLYLQTFNDFNAASEVLGFDVQELNKLESQAKKYFIIIEFNNQYGFDIKSFFKNCEMLIPYNTPLEVKNIINGTLKSKYDSLVEEYGDDDFAIAEAINNDIINLKDNDKLNTSWIVVNVI